MRILLLDGAPPSTTHSGKSVRLLNLFRRLGKTHELHYLAIAGPADSQEVPVWLRELVASAKVWKRDEREFKLGRYVNWLAVRPWFYAPWRYPADYRNLSADLRQWVRDEKVDIVHCFDEEVAQFVPDGLSCPWISDPADAMALHAARRGEQTQGFSEKLRWKSMAWRLGRYEEELVGRSHATVFVSPIDAACYSKNGHRERIRVIPNGVDAEHFVPRCSSVPDAQVPTVLFTGHLSFEPNRDAARFLIDQLFPKIRQVIPEAVCAIVGADPTADLLAKHDGRSIFVTGRVDDLRPYFEKAGVYLCPMRLGAGIKNKLLEAMAMGKAIVTTSRGAEGLSFRDGEHLVIADDAEALVGRTLELLRDAPKRDALGRSARQLVLERYSWDSAVQEYESIYRRLHDGD